MDDAAIYRGPDSCDCFFQDLMQTTGANNGEVLVVAPSQDMLARSCGAEGREFERLAKLQAIANIKCLVWETTPTCSSVSEFQFRALPKQQIGPTGYFVFGNKHALVLYKGAGVFQFVVIRCAAVAQDYRNHFFALWGMATPLFPEISRKTSA
ncbi:MAG: hypothetical protein P4M15_14325 [Alphaproteobacteria bacterium]|nr:hypothetical protein [Alphaproteobacteria bacterium]